MSTYAYENVFFGLWLQMGQLSIHYSKLKMRTYAIIALLMSVVYSIDIPISDCKVVYASVNAGLLLCTSLYWSVLKQFVYTCIILWCV